MSSLDKDTRYWRSLEELEGQPELRALLENEFPEQAEELSDPLSRRRFMQLMGASLAFAGVAGAGCRRWEKDEIVPLSERPEDYVPGVAESYATSMEIGGVAHGLVVTSYDGRPIKVEGNEKHPMGTGATTALAQASILNLYDPDRSLSIRRAQGAGSWSDFVNLVKNGLNLGTGAGFRILCEATTSPTVAALRKQLLTMYPQARWHEYEPLSMDNEVLGTKMVYGRPLRPIARINRARRVVAIDVDFLVLHPASLRYAEEYGLSRNPDQSLNEDALMRLYAIESTFSNTGAMADHRLPLPSSEIPAFVAALDEALDGRMPSGTDARSKFIVALVNDLTKKANQNRSVVVAGHRQPPVVHALVARINHKLKAVNYTVEYRELPEAETHIDSIRALATDMNAGAVKTLLILGGNPVYDAPADIQFQAGLAKVETSIHVSHYYDETSARCAWHVPRAHYLEAWGDARSYEGTVSIIQPLIEPLKRPGEPSSGGRSLIEVLALFAGRDHISGQDLVKQTFDTEFQHSALAGGRSWRRALHDGYVVGTAYPIVVPDAPGAVNVATPAGQLGGGNVEIVFTPSSHTYDGRFANNGWLQETPDFMTKLTWDNAALINPNTADELGIKNGEIVQISLAERTVEVAAYTLPGQARNSIALAVGHGRTRAGRVGGSVEDSVSPTGFDVYAVRTSDAAYVATGGKVRGTGKSYALASTQEHWKMDDLLVAGSDKRMPEVVREATLQEFKDNPDFPEDRAHEVEMPIKRKDLVKNGKSLWEEHTYDRPRDGGRTPPHKWGMAIDLDKCTGCNSCMLACQAENNVPLVGKEQVMRNREMHWIRIDRYFRGNDVRDNPYVAHQPVACQQCEMAPCEEVCPVGATIHSHEGLNDMVYNRCVGTRYCLNNCPYKVRRFNYLDYQNRPEAVGGSLEESRNSLRKLLMNPDVTVRARGVMEKCTFCIQRIQRHKIEAKNERRRIADGEIQTACQQACPSNAIIFGDLNDKTSKVNGAHRNKRAYALLSGLYTKPRNLFLARIRNPNPELA